MDRVNNYFAFKYARSRNYWGSEDTLRSSSPVCHAWVFRLTACRVIIINRHIYSPRLMHDTCFSFGQLTDADFAWWHFIPHLHASVSKSLRLWILRKIAVRLTLPDDRLLKTLMLGMWTSKTTRTTCTEVDWGHPDVARSRDQRSNDNNRRCSILEKIRY